MALQFCLLHSFSGNLRTHEDHGQLRWSKPPHNLDGTKTNLKRFSETPSHASDAEEK